MPLALTDQALMCMRKDIIYARSMAVGGSDDLPEGRNLAHGPALSMTQLIVGKSARFISLYPL